MPTTKAWASGAGKVRRNIAEMLNIGHVIYNSGVEMAWEGQQGYGAGDVLRLLLDSDAGTLAVKKNGTLLGVSELAHG